MDEQTDKQVTETERQMTDGEILKSLRPKVEQFFHKRAHPASKTAGLDALLIVDVVFIISFFCFIAFLSLMGIDGPGAIGPALLLFALISYFGIPLALISIFVIIIYLFKYRFTQPIKALVSIVVLVLSVWLLFHFFSVVGLSYLLSSLLSNAQILYSLACFVAICSALYYLLFNRRNLFTVIFWCLIAVLSVVLKILYG